MSNARIDRMVRELKSEPSSQFFQDLFGLLGLGEKPATSNADEFPRFQRVQGGAD